MQKRKYSQLKAVEGLILSMRQDGMTLQEIADELLKELFSCHFRKPVYAIQFTELKERS